MRKAPGTAGETVAIIPARGGSKGIPGKNLARVGGRPLVARAVDAALHATRIDRVIVTTDDARIEKVARDAGAEVVLRPADLATDTATSESALLHALDTIREEAGRDPEFLVFVQCTSPFVKPEDLDSAVQLLHEDQADSVFTATPHHGYLWRTASDGSAGAVAHDPKVRLRRQDDEPRFLETGAVYAMRTEGFREARHRFFGRIRFVEMEQGRALEIDTPHDLELARALAEGAARSGRASRLPALVRGIVFDFDGVLTDDRVLVEEGGKESVHCHRGDGAALARLFAQGYEMTVLSVEKNPVVAARCKKLKMPCRQGIDDKLTALREWSEGTGVPLAETIYVGNDLPDIPCLLACGAGIAPADAHPDARAAAGIVLDTPGGRGIVREIEGLLASGAQRGTQGAR